MPPIADVVLSEWAVWADGTRPQHTNAWDDVLAWYVA